MKKQRCGSKPNRRSSAAPLSLPLDNGAADGDTLWRTASKPLSWGWGQRLRPRNGTDAAQGGLDLGRMGERAPRTVCAVESMARVVEAAKGREGDHGRAPQSTMVTGSEGGPSVGWATVSILERTSRDSVGRGRRPSDGGGPPTHPHTRATTTPPSLSHTHAQHLGV